MKRLSEERKQEKKTGGAGTGSTQREQYKPYQLMSTDNCSLWKQADRLSTQLAHMAPYTQALRYLGQISGEQQRSNVVKCQEHQASQL